MNYYKIRDMISYPDRWGLDEINVDDTQIFTTGQPVDFEELEKLKVKTHVKGVALDYTETTADHR